MNHSISNQRPKQGFCSTPQTHADRPSQEVGGFFHTVQHKMLCNPIERISDGVPRLGFSRGQGLPVLDARRHTDTQQQRRSALNTGKRSH